MQDVDEVIEASAELIKTHDLDLEEVRDVVLEEMMAEQYLPTDPARHFNP